MRNHHISSVSLVTAKLMFKESAATEKNHQPEDGWAEKNYSSIRKHKSLRTVDGMVVAKKNGYETYALPQFKMLCMFPL